MKTVYARKGCAGFVFGESSDDGRASFCARCKRNRTSHTRRMRIIDGGKHEEGAPMSATHEATHTISAERKIAVVDALAVLLLADAGAAIHLTVSDPDRWDQVKEAVRPPRVRLIRGTDRLKICESFVCRSGDIVWNASGPEFYPTREQHEQMLDEREEG